jgi:serine/threonine protein kinase
MYGIESLLAGRTLVDRYLVEEVIGRGGMGAVYRATDERLGRAVALKVIAAATADEDAHARLRARFHREARAAAGLHHPNVVAVYDFGTDPTLQLDFLVMELLRGEDLAARLARVGTPTLPLALTVLLQAARGLAAGHRAGLIHRDVKPGNLYLEPGDHPGEVHVRVLDFGIADVTLDDQTVTHLTVFGHSPFSPAYASPEQLRGESRLTPASDVFSLGAVGYHLVTGKRALTSSDADRMVVELAEAVAALRTRAPLLPRPVEAILRRALSPSARDRFPDAGAFADAIEPTLQGRDGHPVAPEATRWTREPNPKVNGTQSEDRTRLLTSPFRSGGAVRRDLAQTQFLDPLPRSDAGVDRSAATRAAPAAAAPAAVEKRRGWFRRMCVAVWNFCVTSVVAGLFMGSWTLAAMGVQNGDLGAVYAGVAGSTALAPLTVYRIMGRRSSYRLALIGSIAASVAAVFLLGPGTEGSRLLPAIFGLQLVASVIIGRFTRRAEPAHSPEPHHVPIRT